MLDDECIKLEARYTQKYSISRRKKVQNHVAFLWQVSALHRAGSKDQGGIRTKFRV
jgi:hypothetical protein